MYNSKTYKLYTAPPKFDSLLGDDSLKNANVASQQSLPPPDELDHNLFISEGALMPNEASISVLNGYKLKQQWICEFYMKLALRYRQWAAARQTKETLAYLTGARSPLKVFEYINISTDSFNAIISSTGFQNIKYVIDEHKNGPKVQRSLKFKSNENTNNKQQSDDLSDSIEVMFQFNVFIP